MPPFKVEYSVEALSQLESLNKSIIRRIVKKIESSRSDPHKLFKRLTARQEYKLRVGDYRVIALIHEDAHTIFIQSMGHRSNVYDRA